MEKIQTTYDKAVRNRFQHSMSKKLDGSMTDQVVGRLAETNAMRIFYSGMLEKATSAVANVIVETAAKQITTLAREDGRDILKEKIAFFLDRHTIATCNEDGYTMGKQIVYTLDKLFDKFDGDTASIWQVIGYVGIRKGDDALFDMFTLYKIADLSKQLREAKDQNLITTILNKEIASTKRDFEIPLKDIQRVYGKELSELQLEDPDYVLNNGAIEIKF